MGRRPLFALALTMKARALLTLSLFILLVSAPLGAATLGEEVEAALQVVSVSGREEPAADFILGRLRGLPASRDALGNVVLTAGSGEPRRLVACALGEPGFVVSAIRDDGYLRVVPAGDGLNGALWTQSHEGNTVVIGGAAGWRPGAVVLPSVHLQQGVTPIREPALPGYVVRFSASSACCVFAASGRLPGFSTGTPSRQMGQSAGV
jgi:hypothetical protein